MVIENDVISWLFVITFGKIVGNKLYFTKNNFISISGKSNSYKINTVSLLVKQP